MARSNDAGGADSPEFVDQFAPYAHSPGLPAPVAATGDKLHRLVDGMFAQHRPVPTLVKPAPSKARPDGWQRHWRAAVPGVLLKTQFSLIWIAFRAGRGTPQGYRADVIGRVGQHFPAAGAGQAAGHLLDRHHRQPRFGLAVRSCNRARMPPASKPARALADRLAYSGMDTVSNGSLCRARGR